LPSATTCSGMKRLRDNLGLWLLLVVDLAVRAYGIADPWFRGHRGFSGALSGIIARNYNRYGWWDTKFMPLWHSGPLSPHEMAHYAHLRHPSLRYLLTSVFTGVFGLQEWAINLVPILFSLGSALALYLLVKRTWGRWTALLAVAFLIVLPMDVYYGSTSLYEPIGMCFALFALYFYARWLESSPHSNVRLLIPVFLCLWLAAWTDYPGYYMIGLIGLHILAFGPSGRRKWFVAAALGALALACFGLWVGYAALASGSVRTFIRGVELRAGAYEARFTFWAYYTLQYMRIREFFTPTLRLLAAGWAIFCLLDWRDRAARWRHSWVALLLGYGLANLVIFRQGSWVHDFWLFFLSPFFAVASAVTLRELARRMFGIEDQVAGNAGISSASPTPLTRAPGRVAAGVRKALFALLLLAVWAWYLPSAIDSLQALYRPRDEAETPLARYLHERTAFEEGVLVGFEPLQPHFDYYLDRRLAEFDELEEFERLRQDSHFRWCVLRAPRTVDEGLVRELIRSYPMDTFQNYVIFDLWGDRAKPSVEPAPQAEEGRSLIPGVVLLGYDGPGYIRLPGGDERDLLQRYIRATPMEERIAPSSQVTFTVYWQAGAAIETDIRPTLRLTAYDGARTHVAESAYAPVTDLYSTGLWTPGEVIAAPYVFELDQEYPPGVYTLEAKGGEATLPVGYLAIERGAPPEGTVTLPAIENRIERRLDNGTTLIGYEHDRSAYQPGETMKLKLYWQANARPAAAGVSVCLENGRYQMCQPAGVTGGPDWQAGLTYLREVNLRLHPAMLPGRYRLILRAGPSPEEKWPLGEVPVGPQPAEQADLHGLLRPLARLGEADWRGDALLMPNKDLTLHYALDAPAVVRLAVDWTGMAELSRTRVDAYVHRPDVPDDYLGTVEVSRGAPARSFWTVPEVLTRAGENTLLLRVSAEPQGLHRMGWRGLLDRLFPDLLNEVSGPWSGAIQIDLARVECDWVEAWGAYRDLMRTYAEREMWAEAAGVYGTARSRGIKPEHISELSVLAEIARRGNQAQMADRLREEEARLIPNPMGVSLGGVVRLEGYEFRRIGRRVEGRLYFRNLTPTEFDWTLWLHVTPEPAAQATLERQAGGSKRAEYTIPDQRLDTSHWQPGRLYEVTVSGSLPPGRYEVRLGLWRWEDGSRLWRDDAPAEHEINLGWMEW